MLYWASINGTDSPMASSSTVVESQSRSPSRTPSRSPTPVPNVRYERQSWETLSDWLDNDGTKCCLIEREHAPGREGHAIKFAEYMNGWKRRPADQKQKYPKYPDFYKYLQNSVTPGANYDTRKPDDKTGFSESSCKRLAWEGNCYINLLKNRTNDFPQSQSAAVALHNNTTEKNILEVWNCALDLYRGNKKRISKCDILTAVERCKMRNTQAALEAEAELRNANEKVLESQKKAKDMELKAKKMELKAKEMEKKATDMQLKIDDLENSDRPDVDALNVKKRKLLDKFCLGYEDEDCTVPINSQERLIEVFNSDTDKVYLDCIPDKDGNDVITCDNLDEWKELFYLHGLKFNNKKRALLKRKGKMPPSPPNSG